VVGGCLDSDWLVVLFLCLKRRNGAKKEAEPADVLKRTRSSTSSFGNFISNPIMTEGQQNYRTDFGAARATSPVPPASAAPPTSATPAIAGEQQQQQEQEQELPSVTGALIRDSTATGITGGGAGVESPAYIDEKQFPLPPEPTHLSSSNLGVGVADGGYLPSRAARQSSIAYGYGMPEDNGNNNNNNNNNNSNNAVSPFVDAAGVGYAEGGQTPDYQGGGYYISDEYLQMPQTPRRDREPSSVSINVFADPHTITPESVGRYGGGSPQYGDAPPQYGGGGGSPQYGGEISPQYDAGGGGGAAGDRNSSSRLTTFTSMMEQADLGGVARGESYIPYNPDSARSTPDPRGRR
jgi:hypothetical protein